LQINSLSDNPKHRVKQSKVASVPPPPPAAPKVAGPRYRYFSTTPTTVTLRMRDLQVPEKARTARYNSEQFVDLPCADIFGGPMPKIRLSRLAELAPDCVTAKDLPDEGVKVCSARLALAYLVTEERELIQDAPTPAPAAQEEFAPQAPAAPASEAPGPISEAPEMAEFLPPARPPKPDLPSAVAKPAPVEESAPKPLAKPSFKAPIPPVVPKVPARPGPGVSPTTEAAAPPDSPAGEVSPPPSPAQSPEPSASIPAAKKPFSLFPMFRRKEASDNKPSVQVPRGRIEIPKPKRPFSPTDPTAEPEAPVVEPVKEVKLPAPKPSIPKPRFEPKTAPATRQPSPPPEPPKAPEMPELPILTPKVPTRPSEPAQSAPQPAEPAPVAGEKSKTQPVTPPAPVGAAPAEPESDTPAGSVTPAPEAPVIPPSVTPPSEAAAPAPEPPPAAVKPSEPSPAPAAEPPKPAPEPPKAPPAPPSSESAVLVETEHVSKKDVPPEIPEQDSLQALFHTEEQLSVDRVLELCGNLPGIHSCVLSHGSDVIAAHNTPDSVDIVSLSAHALEMLKAMRASSAKMGIGAVPAVTVHSEKGPITFFHQEDLCLLVLHKDRAFIPGVREKLQFVMDELAKAKLPLRLGDGAGKKLTGP
jgi:predicted regulator of Ras-like GTPase activity (Roadblock/LC7/MglB family)